MTHAAHLTDPERQVVYLLAQAWEQFLLLPKEHPMQDAEFCSAIHRAQDQVLMRVGRRSLNYAKTQE